MMGKCGFKLSLLLIAFLLIIGLTEVTYAQADKTSSLTLDGLWIALAIGIPAAAGAFAVATTGSSALSAMAEKPEIAGSAIIIVALAEGIAIYGLLVAVLMILFG